MAQDRPPLAAFARRVLVAAGIVVVGLLLWRIADALLLASGAVLIAVLLRAAAEPLARRTLPEGWAIAAVALLALAGLGLVAALAGAEVRARASDLARRLPDAWEVLQERVSGTEYGERLLERAGDAAPDAGGVWPASPGPPSRPPVHSPTWCWCCSAASTSRPSRGSTAPA